MKPEIAQEFSLEELNRVLKNVQRQFLGGTTTSVTKVVSAGIQSQVEGSYDPLGAAAAVQTKLTEHTSATGTRVHGLGTFSVVNGSAIGLSMAVVASEDDAQALIGLENAAIGPGSSTAGHYAIFASDDGRTLADAGPPPMYGIFNCGGPEPYTDTDGGFNLGGPN